MPPQHDRLSTISSSSPNNNKNNNTNMTKKTKSKKKSSSKTSKSTTTTTRASESVFDTKELLRELEEHNKYFDNLVNMMPAKLYVPGNTGDEEYNPKFKKGQHKLSKEARRARNKVEKTRKFEGESTQEAKRRKEQEEYENDDDDDDSSDGDHEIQDNHEEENEMDMELTTTTTTNNDDAISTSKSNENQSRIEMLRAKLRAKIEAQQSKRPGGGNNNSNTSSALISKRAARRAEKQRRIELAKKKNAAGGGGSTQTGKRGNGKNDQSFSLVNGRDDNGKEKNLGGSKKLSSSTTESKAEDLSGIDFGGIAGLNADQNLSNYSSNANKSLKNLGKKKSLDRLLMEAEKKKERLEQLKASENLEDKEKAKKIAWGDTLKAASGEKMKKNDPALLKKAMKRKAKKKTKSQEAWKTRMEQVKDKMDERQQIRQHNIGQRSLGGAAGANLSKKRIEDLDDKDGEDGNKGKKRPRLGPHSGKARAGFEGKKQDFINKGGKGGDKQ